MTSTEHDGYLGEMIFFVVAAIILAITSIVGIRQRNVAKHFACKYIAETVKADINIMGQGDDLRQNCNKDDLLLFLPPVAVHQELDFDRVEREICMKYDVNSLHEMPKFTLIKELWRRGDLFCEDEPDLENEYRCSGGNSVGNWQNWWISPNEYDYLMALKK